MHFDRASSYASAVLAISCRNSVRPFVRLFDTRVLCDETKQGTAYFDTTRKSNHSTFLTPTLVGGRRTLFIIIELFSLSLTVDTL